MTTSRKTLSVILEGHGDVRLTQNDYLATGGEGTVFRHGGFVIKVYLDSKKMQREGMTEKIRLLASIRHPYIVSPRGIVTDMHGQAIGFFMNHVDGEPLPRIFTNAFWTRNGFAIDHASTLIDRMRDTLQAAHGSGAILVDANEMNWLTMFGGIYGKPEPRVIDVDSWAIGRWPATVIMPSVRDWHTSGFGRESDWFAWGIVSFQVYTGIHPYKGGLDGFKPGELERRMRENASVFSPGIRLNAAVRDFSTIPGKLFDWYKATFQHGQRTIPPSPFDKGFATAHIAQTKRMFVGANSLVVYEKIFDQSGDPALRIFPCGAVLLRSGMVFDLTLKTRIAHAAGSGSEVISVIRGWLVAEMKDGNVWTRFIERSGLTEHVLRSPVRGTSIVRFDNRLFVVTENGLTELCVTILGKPVLSVGQTWGALPNSTRWFDGIGVQDTFGAIYLIAPFGDQACAHIRVRELDGLTPLSAKAGNRFATIVASDQSGAYRKFEFSFGERYDDYRLWESGTDHADLNIAILPRGVCATIINDGILDIFVPRTGALKKVTDRSLNTRMALDRIEENVVYIENGALWQVRLK
jgi:hypothetical protein